MSTRRATWVGIGIAVVLFVGVMAVMALTNGRASDGSGYVKVACRDWVKGRLKAPASANFTAESVTRSGDTYTVTGNVDSQNAFGTPIRNTYSCTASRSGDGTRLVSLTGLSN